MRLPSIGRITLLSLVLSALTSLAAVAQQAQMSDQEKLYGLSLFWKEVSYNFAYFDQVEELDWDQAYQQYIPRVLATENAYEYYRVLSRFAGLLNDGMTTIEMPEGLVDEYVGFPAIRLAEANRQAIVVAVDKALAAELPLGSVILAVDGRESAAVLEQDVFPYISSSTTHILWDQGIRGNKQYGYGLLAGAPGSNVKLKIRVPDGEIKELNVSRRHNKQAVDWHAARGIRHEESFSMKWLDDQLAYVALNNFSDMAVVENFIASLPQLKKANGLVIDLRFNEGGNTFLAEEILKYLTFRDLTGARSRMRVHNSTYKAWGKFARQYDWAKEYGAYYNGEAWQESEANVLYADEIALKDKLVITTAILISRETARAAEDFLVYADGVKHFKTIGEPTFGSTGQPLFFDLPGGGKGKICSKRETFADGRDFVGYGIQPDILVKRDADYYLSESDLTLEKAYLWLTNEVKKETLVAVK
ncbi:S41 family peptidase [Thalassomonas sp. RHCl1]|uniref:S41 family peptidase n=1 Tax=Thalassomonas sp. RHCl1 TaxID=2995320 RepID=UPI00248B0909|nr:S41 family peptidase [Thalassomonas sp. RHCl1]